MDADFVRDVLQAIADDYEDVETILLDLRNWHPERIINIEEVSGALKQLTERGLAKAYELSATKGEDDWATAVPFDGERVDELHFYITAEGKRELSS